MGLAFWQALLFGLVGAGLALPFIEPAPGWAFVVPAIIGAAWAIPMEVSVGPETMVIRNPIRRHVIPIDAILGVECSDWVSGKGRRVRLRTTSRRRPIGVAALALDNCTSTETMDLVIQEQQAQRRRCSGSDDEKQDSDDGPDPVDENLLKSRARWFASYATAKNVCAPRRAEPYSCPCCGHLTLDERGAYEICWRCGWEDDGQDEHDSHVVRGGPNGRLSLDSARRRYADQGGTLEPHSPPAPPM